jgi:hypothetical protein
MLLKNGRDLLRHLRIDDTNPLDELAGTVVKQEKLGLFAFFNDHIAKVTRRYRSPVDLVELIESMKESRVISSSVARAESPTPVVSLSPPDHRVQVRFKVYDESLAICIG